MFPTSRNTPAHRISPTYWEKERIQLKIFQDKMFFWIHYYSTEIGWYLWRSALIVLTRLHLVWMSSLVFSIFEWEEINTRGSGGGGYFSYTSEELFLRETTVTEGKNVSLNLSFERRIVGSVYYEVFSEMLVCEELLMNIDTCLAAASDDFSEDFLSEFLRRMHPLQLRVTMSIQQRSNDLYLSAYFPPLDGDN